MIVGDFSPDLSASSTSHAYADHTPPTTDMQVAFNALSDPRGNGTGEYGLHEVSNDKGIELILQHNGRDWLRNARGIGLFIGSGGLLSLAPDLVNLDLAVMVDMNPAVHRVSKMLVSLILSSETPDEVREQIFMRHPAAEPAKRQIYGARLDWKIEDESLNYGSNHWTDPQRFRVVKEALAKLPIARITADISSPRLQKGFTQTAAQFATTIGFANFTNVAAWLSSFQGKGMDFLSSYPFNPCAVAIYSQFDRDNDKLKFRGPFTIHQYIKIMEEERANYFFTHLS